MLYKRYKKVICLLLIFSLCFSLFAVPAAAIEPVTLSIASVVAIGACVVLTQQLASWGADFIASIKDSFVSTFIGSDLTGIEIGDGDLAVGYVFKAYRDDKVYTPGTSVLVSFESLSDLTLTLNSHGISSTLTTRTVRTTDGIKTYWFITPHSEDIIRQANLVAGTTNGEVWLCNSSGFPFHAVAAEDKTSSTNTNYNYYTQEGNDSSTTNNEYNYTTGDTVNNPVFKYGDEITENNQVYDYSSDSYVEVGDISYDASTKQYTTNITIDNSVHVQYNIDHTSITYIGSSAEDKTYNLYYELPDGRNSSELTAEDLEQLVLNYNVINYGVSADDGRLRALYHFDGDLEDSSYWSKYSKWDWTSGASITYLDSNAFGGSLYLDENAHQFTITLPSNLAASDFSVLFRYYHSADDSTSAGNDLVVSTGANTLWAITAGTATTSNVPVGQWTEIAFIRDGTTLYCYVNGVVKANVPITGTFGDTLTFTFSSGATYRQLDELRVYNFATSEAGADYTPTAVPVDTNAVLILPDQATPIPDGYWDFNTDGNLLTYQDFSQGLIFDSYYVSANTSTTDNSNKYFNSPTNNYSGFFSGSLIYDNNSSGSTVTYSDYVNFGKYHSFDSNEFVISTTPVNSSYSFDTPFIYSAGFVPLVFSTSAYPSYVLGVYFDDGSNRYNPFDISPGSDVSFSLVSLSGDFYSATVSLPTSAPSSSVVSVTPMDAGYMGIFVSPSVNIWNGNVIGYCCFAFFVPTTSSGLDIVYMELKNGEPNDNTDAYVTEIYSDLDLTMPTVAIRSQISIREYRIGGVRPTVPYRGDVWLMVEDSYITSAQIYTGFAWQEVDLRIWTGQRWVSALYFNIMTQQDYTDILGTTDNEYIQSTEGFYSWLTKQFKELLAILNEISDQIEEIDSGSGASLDFTFEIDGSTTVEFTKLSDDARNGLLSVMKPMYEVVFAELGTIYDGVLDDFVLLFSDTEDTITVDGETGYTFWYIFKADQEVWNVRNIS